MRKIFLFLRRYPLTTILVITIWILCFISIPKTPLDKVTLIDKWTHITMYLSLCLAIILETVIIPIIKDKRDTKATSIKTDTLKKEINMKRWSTFSLSFLLPLFMGGLIEIFQANFTNGRRNGDWYDFYADGLGVVLAQIIGILSVWFLSTRKKD